MTSSNSNAFVNNVKEAIKIELIVKGSGIKYDYKLNRVDKIYHTRVLNIKDPHAMINKIKEIKRCEANLTSVSTRNYKPFPGNTIYRIHN